MKMKYIRWTILAYFLTDSVNWQVPEGKEKYLFNSLYQQLKNKISLKQNYAVKNLFLPRTNK